ncbi:uncharacterized protein PHACADRAFT_202865 [Phanerochaete carnosa HHB-10118-sp]|uniref:Uncharacterized protein n=1 Tax=Phanerochaete carnosa (strain HHB-10118-sp) TaxID=650164 RepID=K5WE19_PHACS|nr:uncharacterized protein PHACADRAFT_202865 [Phanerochaete carnosa HHB-10118-sp]EKM48397.1 hypothetical protein PHACADRAFT_202865 [Phanerochaete carnosa HHB-10118-sp]
MSPNSARATSPASPDTTSTLASLHELDRPIAPLASDAPPELQGVAQRKLIDISDMRAQKESGRDRVRAELFGAASGHDGHVTESDVEADGQSSDDDSGAGSDDDSDDAQGQLLPVRRHVSPPLEHFEYRVVSPPSTFPQNWVLGSRRMSPNTTAKHPETTTFDKRPVQRYPPLASPHRTDKQRTQPYKAPPCLATTPLPSDAMHLRAAPTASKPQPSQSIITHAPTAENQKGKKRALEIVEVKEEEVDEKPRKRHAANRENFTARYSKYDDEERVPEGPRPKRSRRNPVRSSLCHPSRHVENHDRLRAAGVSNVPTAAPIAVVARLAPATAAPGAAPGPAVVAPAAQPAQGAFVIIPPPPAPVYLPPVNQALAALPDPPYSIALPPIVAPQPATTQNLRMQLGFVMRDSLELVVEFVK